MQFGGPMQITIEITDDELAAAKRVIDAIEHGDAYTGDDGDAVQWFLQRCVEKAEGL